ncbi:Putative uncharacterized protein [Propionibacterium freudenreichii]|nr:Putative uncharacterized protein [Propionibacterium freudenreichii]CEI24272.1 Putative uncharacterized protein [Propionibacterium freudenreichii]
MKGPSSGPTLVFRTPDVAGPGGPAQLLGLVAGGKDAGNSELEKAGSHETGAGFPVTWRTDTDHQGF